LWSAGTRRSNDAGVLHGDTAAAEMKKIKREKAASTKMAPKCRKTAVGETTS
jgi:hypothetical protein